MSPQAPTDTVVACSQCKRMFSHSDLVQIADSWVCGDCKPAFLSRVMVEGAAAAGPFGWHYGGFWIRFAARFIDGFVMMAPILILAAVLIPNLLRAGKQPSNPAFAAFSLTLVAIFFVAAISYEVLMMRYWGATVGKMACGLKIVRSDGRSLGWGVSFGRFFMWNIVTGGIPYLNLVLMLTSCIMAGADAEKRALHDRVCDTRVIYKRSLMRA
jgi:uncharacterized RDD family membrane protein YckC